MAVSVGLSGALDRPWRIEIGIIKRMRISRNVCLAGGVAAGLFVLLFPPLRSPTDYYTQPQVVEQQAVAVRLSRFSAWRPNLARLPHGVVVRTEIDPGELLRELALILVVFGASYLWLPTLVDRLRLASAQTKSPPSEL